MPLSFLSLGRCVHWRDPGLSLSFDVSPYLCFCSRVGLVPWFPGPYADVFNGVVVLLLGANPSPSRHFSSLSTRYSKKNKKTKIMRIMRMRMMGAFFFPFHVCQPPAAYLFVISISFILHIIHSPLSVLFSFARNHCLLTVSCLPLRRLHLLFADIPLSVLLCVPYCSICLHPSMVCSGHDRQGHP